MLLTQYSSGDKFEKTEMGGSCSTYGGREEMYVGFWLGNPRERAHLEYPGVDGRIIYGPKSGEATREWRKVYNEELNDLYSSPNTVRVIKLRKNEMGGACST